MGWHSEYFVALLPQDILNILSSSNIADLEGVVKKYITVECWEE